MFKWLKNLFSRPKRKIIGTITTFHTVKYHRDKYFGLPNDGKTGYSVEYIYEDEEQ